MMLNVEVWGVRLHPWRYGQPEKGYSNGSEQALDLEKPSIFFLSFLKIIFFLYKTQDQLAVGGYRVRGKVYEDM